MALPFYADGIRFACTRCSSCCRSAQGYVFLGKEDLRRLLGRLGLAFAAFFRQYCTVVDMGFGLALSLAEKANHDCVFWDEAGCAIYEDRPVQCSTYPFWDSLLESRADWCREAVECPGIGRGGLCSQEQIEDSLIRRRAVGTLLLDPVAARNPESIDEDTLLGR